MRLFKNLDCRTASSVVALAMSAVVWAGPAAAQTQATASAADGLEEIIVTANKRSENLQDVPAAISVISGDQIANSGAVNLENVTASIPSLNFRKGGTSLNSSLFLRGVGTINFSIAAEPSVAVVLDGVVLARAGEGFGDLNDIARIEVLRGPQSTLFGKNASAGIISIVSKMPKDTFGGSVEASYFEGNEYKLKGVVNAPLGTNIAARITGFYGSYDGNITNLTTNKKINGYERYGVRGIITAEASDALKLTLIADWRKADDNCCGEVIGTAGNPLTATAAQQAVIRAILPGVSLTGDKTREVRNNLATSTKETSWGVSLQGDYDIADHTLTSITAYRKWDNREIREGDWLDQVYREFNQLHDDGPQKSNTFSQELRLASPSNQMFEYVVGGYFYRAKADRFFARNDIVCTATTATPIVAGATPCPTTGSTFTTPNSDASFGSIFTNFAGFGQATFNASDSFRLIGGLRLTHDKLSYYHNRRPSPIAGPGVRTDTTGFADETTKTNLSGKAGVQFDVNDDVMLYGTYTRGYKGPAYNVFFNQNATQRNVIEAETANAYETGFKGSFIDRKLTVNAALFYAKYNNFQANNFDVLNGVVVTRLSNAGNVSTKGFELDVTARPVPNFNFGAAVAYTDAQIEAFRDNTGTISTARKGESLALSPTWKWSTFTDYTIETGSGFNVQLGASLNVTSKQYSDLGVNPLLLLHSTAILDASIAVLDENDVWSVRLVGKNLTDESYASLITPGGPGGSLRYLIPREADRYFGVIAKFNFGGK
jgi:iron complex outermembrane recepter protein